MKKSTKKFVAAICAGAMVVSSMAVYDSTGNVLEVQAEANAQNSVPNAASSADLASASFLGGEVGAGQYKAVCGSGAVNEIVSIQKFGAATEYGIYVSFKDADFGEITVNGVTIEPFIEGSGIIFYLSSFEYMYSDVVIYNSSGAEKVILYVYNANGIDNSNGASIPEIGTNETTVNGGSDENPTSGNTETTQNPDTNAASFADLHNAAFLNGDAGAGQYKAVCGNGLIAGIVNIQKPGAATEFGIYVSFKDANIGNITVNGVPLNGFIDGAGAVLYLSNFEYMYSDVVVYNTDGTVKAVLYVYNSKGIDNSDGAIEPETTTVDTSAKLELTKLATNNGHQEFGSYKLSANVNIEAYAGIDPTNRDHLQVQNASGPTNNSFTVSRAFKGLTAGVKYVLSVDITPSVANGSYKTLKDSDYISLQGGTTTVSMVSTAYNDGTGVIQADFVLYVNQLGADVVLDISNPQYREYVEGETTTVAEPTTDEGETSTTVEPTTAGGEDSTSNNVDETTINCTTPPYPTTTVAPTTKANETTVTPTTKPNETTVTPTTKPNETTVTDAKCSSPAKAVLKKITAKKKASKVLKLTLKKINGAVGYQVQISKAKKFTNKNILVKKYVKKLNVSIKSKKIKNKSKLYVRVRAYVLDAGKKKYGAWSKVKKAKIK